MAMLRLWTMTLFLLALIAAGCTTTPGNQGKTRGEAVVLLHGLGRDTRAMRFLQYRLEQAGYETFNMGYPSTRLPPDEILRLLHDQLQQCCKDKKKVHFVAHSLGGLIVRALLEERPYVNLGRVVLLGTPSQGSALVDWLHDNYLFRVLAGPTAQQIGTGRKTLFPAACQGRITSWASLPAPTASIPWVPGCSAAQMTVSSPWRAPASRA